MMNNYDYLCSTVIHFKDYEMLHLYAKSVHLNELIHSMHSTCKQITSYIKRTYYIATL